MFGNMKGQGATEYLVLLAVVLVIALVSIALLGVFPSFSTDTKIQQSKAYWQSAAPIALVDYAMTGTTLNLILQNNGADTITVNTINAASTTLATDNVTINPGSTLGAGSRSTAQALTLAACTPSGTFKEYNIVITYKTASGLTITETGARPISLKCS